MNKIASMLEVCPFDEASADRYGRKRAQLEMKGAVISERDTQIAAIALPNRLTVVTHHVKEFQRVERRSVEDCAPSS